MTSNVQEPAAEFAQVCGDPSYPTEHRRGSLPDHCSGCAPAAEGDALRIALYKVDTTHQFHGDACLCGFTSARSRSRTEHITTAVAELLSPPEPLTEDSFCRACSHLRSGPPHPECIHPGWHVVTPPAEGGAS